MDILHISASPKGGRSDSLQLADRFLDRYAKANPDHTIRHLDVFDDAHNPDFGAVQAFHKFAPIFGEPQTDEGKAAWVAIEALIVDFDKADKIVLSCPMWNYSVPWAMKRYLDNLMQPGRTFGYNFETQQHIGLLRNRPIQFLLTRSSTMTGDYPDFQLPYLRYVFDAIGIRDTRVVCAWATTKPTPEARQTYIDSFAGEIDAAAEAF